MFFKTTNFKRKAYLLLTMHKAVRVEFKKQLENTISPDKLSQEQESEIVLFLAFTILKAIEAVTSSKQDFNEISSKFLDLLLDNEDGYGIEGGLREFVLRGITESRFGEYENKSIEVIPAYFIESLRLQDSKSKENEITETVETNFFIVFSEGKKIIQK
jgi:hypothetical protein